MNARLKLNLNRLTGTFDVDPSSSRIYSRDAAIDLIVHGFDENEVTPANEGGATPPGKPVVQFVNSAGRVVAQAMLARPTGDGSGAGADGKYDLVATLSTNTVEMRREFFGAGPQAVREFTVRILDTETANPIACGPFPVFNFPGVFGDAPTELPSASEVLAELRRMVEEHAGRTDNPHRVTAALIEALTQVQADARYALKSSVTSLSSQVSQALNQSAMAAAAARGHAARSDNPHGVTAAQVGLGNVDNTADADKPVSARQQTAITLAKEQVANLVQAEARRATGREQDLQNGIDAESRRASSAESDLNLAIRTEKERAQGAEAALRMEKQSKLSSQQLAAVNSGIDAGKVAKIAQNESAISAETSRATTEEARLQTLINAIKTFEVVVADSLPSPSEQYSKKLYLIPSTNPEMRNVKDEFICVKVDNVWLWEQVGSTAITIEFDDEPTEGSQKAARSGGIWRWVKSLLPSWLTPTREEPPTQAEVASKYTKPSGGIPETDMTEDVKTSLGLANTALQKHQDISGKLDKQYGIASIDWNAEQNTYLRIKNAILDFYTDIIGGLTGVQIGGNTLYGNEWQLTSTLRVFQKIQFLNDAQLTFLDNEGNEESIEDRINRISSLANKYSASSAYTVGQYVFHEGSIYRCTTAIALPGEAWNPAHWSEAQKLDDFFTDSNSLLMGTIDARLPYPLYAVPSTGLLKDRAINTTSLASVTIPDNFTDLLIRASVESSLAVTMPEAIATKYGDTFPGEAGEYLITITKTGAAEAYVRTIKLEEVA